MEINNKIIIAIICILFVSVVYASSSNLDILNLSGKLTVNNDTNITGDLDVGGNITVSGGLMCLNSGCTWNMTGNCMHYPNGATVGTDC